MNGRYRVVSLVIVISLVLTMASTVAFGKVTLTILRDGSQDARWNMLRDEFVKDNPDIDIKYIGVDPGLQARGETVVYFAGDITVDLMTIAEGEWYYSWAKQGLLLDITPFVEKDPDWSSQSFFFPAEYQRSVIDGRWYGVGDAWAFEMLWYNPSFLDQAGLPRIPKTPSEGTFTIDQFIDYARKLTVRDANGQITRAGADLTLDYNVIFSLLLGSGNPIIDKSKMEFTLDDPVIYDGMTKITQALQEGIIRSTNNAQGVTAVLQGKAAMAVDGNWKINMVRDAVSFSKKRNIRIDPVDFGILPHLGPVSGTYAHSGYVGINANTQYPEEAWRFLKWYQSPEVLEMLWKWSGGSPAVAPTFRELVSVERLKPYVNEDDPPGFLFKSFQYMAEGGRTFVPPLGFFKAFNDTFINAMYRDGLTGRKSWQSLIEEVLPVMDGIIQKANSH